MDERLRELVSAQIRAYIKYYRATIQNSFSNTPPIFFTGYPFHVHCYILPNAAVCCAFKYSMNEFKIDFFECDFESFKQKYINEGYDYFLGFLPLYQYSEESAALSAKQNAIRDVYAELHHTRLIEIIENIDASLQKIGQISKANPESKKHLKPVAQAYVEQRAIVEKLISRVEDLDKILLASFERQLLDVVVAREDPRIAPCTQHNIAEIAQYLGLYLQNYRRGVEEYLSKGLYSIRPRFYDGFPHYFQGCLMPNQAAIVFIQYGMAYPSIEVNKENFESVIEIKRQRKYNYLLTFGPHKNFDPEIAIEDARLSVIRDLDSVQCINVYALIERMQEMENISLSIPEDLKLREIEKLILAWLETTEQIKGIYAEMLERETNALLERWEEAYDYIMCITPTKVIVPQTPNFEDSKDKNEEKKEQSSNEENANVGVKWTISKVEAKPTTSTSEQTRKSLEASSQASERASGGKEYKSDDRLSSEVTLPGGLKIQPMRDSIRISGESVSEYRLPTSLPQPRRNYGENKFEDMIMTSKLFEEDDRMHKGKLKGPDYERKRNPSLAVFAFILILMGSLMFFTGYKMSDTSGNDTNSTACMLVVPDQNLYINGGAFLLLIGVVCLVAYIIYKQPA